MESFDFSVKMEARNGADDAWASVKRDRNSYSCRDSAVGYMNEAIQNRLRLDCFCCHTYPGLEVRNITVDLIIHPRILEGINYSIFQEILRCFSVEARLYESVDFIGSERHINLSGNDNHVLPAWYWMILAMRPNIYNSKGDFLTRMKSTSEMNTQTWDCRGDRQNSIDLWIEFLEKGKTPHSIEMIQTNRCPINWNIYKEGHGKWESSNYLPPQ